MTTTLTTVLRAYNENVDTPPRHGMFDTQIERMSPATRHALWDALTNSLRNDPLERPVIAQKCGDVAAEVRIEDEGQKIASGRASLFFDLPCVREALRG
jgi:hypothetical protein